jgi:transposase, IS6 family
MAERGLAVDHTTIWRWVQRYGPEVRRRLRGNVKQKSSTWHMDETFVRIAGHWQYLFRAVDGQGQTVDFYLSETRDREAAKRFLKKALANRDNRPPRVFARDGLRSYPAAIRELQGQGLMHRSCRHGTRPYANNRIESDHRSIKRRLRAMQGPPKLTHGSNVDSRDRGSAHDSQRPGFGNHSKQPGGAGLGIWGTPGRSIIPYRFTEGRPRLLDRSCNTS